MTAEELLELTAHGEAYSSHPIAVSLQEAYGKDVDCEVQILSKNFPVSA